MPLQKRDTRNAPQAMPASKSHTRTDDCIWRMNPPNAQRIPSLLSILWMPLSGLRAANIHEPTAITTSTKRSDNDRYANILFFIGMEIIDIDDAQLDSLHHKTGGIDSHASVAAGEEFLHEFVLTLLKALHSEGHRLET